MPLPRRPFDRAVDAERGPTPLAQHTPHLAQGSWLIRKELQSELAENNVEAVGWEWQIDRAALHPVDWHLLARNNAGNGQQAQQEGYPRREQVGRRGNGARQCRSPGADYR
jgi:hypothetical protein